MLMQLTEAEKESRMPKNKSLVIYLATPYSHSDPAVREARYRKALEYAALLLRMGAFVYSPIAHTHVIATDFELENSFEFFKGFDFAMIERCDILAVAQIDGWRESVGIAAEIEYAVSLHKPVVYLPDPVTAESLEWLTRTAIGESK